MPNKDDIKNKFKSGSTPTEIDFEDLIDFTTNANNLDSGELDNEYLPQEITVNSITANGSGLTNLTASNLVGNIPDDALVNVDASKINSGEIGNEFLPDHISVTKLSGDGSDLTNLTASNLVGNIPDDALVNVDASKINSGEIGNEFLPDHISVTKLSGDGSDLTNLTASNLVGNISDDALVNVNASKINSGTISNEFLPDHISVNKLSGDGSDLINLTASNLVGGIPDNALVNINASKINSGKIGNEFLPDHISVNKLSGNGSELTNLKSSEINGLISSDNIPSASENESGITRFANSNEAQQAEINDKAISPKQLAHVISEKEQAINEQIALVKAGLKFRDNVCVVATEHVETRPVFELNDETEELKIIIDGYEVQDGDRVLLTNQDDTSQNTVWVVSTTDLWEVAEDLDNDIEGEMAIGISVEVVNGLEYANTYWSVSAINNGITWKKRTDLNDFDAGNGIEINGLTISVNENWIKQLNDISAGEGITLNENTVSVNADWVKQLNAISAGEGITLNENTVSVNADWVKQLNDLSAGEGITLNENTVSVNSDWVKQLNDISAGEGITLNENNVISLNQEELISTLEASIGEGIIVENNKININETWLNEKIQEQILLIRNSETSLNLDRSIVMEEAIPMMAPPVEVALDKISVEPVLTPVTYQKLISKPVLAHMENLDGHGVYSLSHMKSKNMNKLAYVENGSNNIKLFDLKRKIKLDEVSLNSRPSHLEYSVVYDSLFYSMGGNLYQVLNNAESSVFLEGVSDFFFTAAGNRCVTRHGSDLRIFDMKNKKLIKGFKITVSGRGGNRTLGSSYNGEYIAVSTGYKKQDVEIFDVKTGTSKTLIIEGASATYSPTPSEDGREVYVGGGFSDGHLYIYDVDSANLSRKFKPFSAYVYQVKPTADPNYVVTGGYNGVLKILNIKDGSQFWSSENIALINEITVTADLKRIYVSSGAGDARFSVFDIK